MPSTALQLLLQTLEERNVNLGADDVAWAFESAGTKNDIELWARDYLSEGSLLTLEEKAFSEKHGQTNTQDASSCPQTSDQSFEDAISSLEASTFVIEKQSRLLEAQRQALHRIQQRTGARNVTASSNPQHSSKVKREQSQLEYESNELADSLQAKFRAATKQYESTSGGLQPNVERILEKDDRLLDGLEKVLPHLADDGADDRNAGETQQLCQALKHFTSADIRARIDAAYLDGANRYSSHSNGVNGKTSRESQQLASLNAELDELCREIDGLSTMAVDNQYRIPIMQAMDTAKGDAETEKASWLEYLTTAIQYSTGRVDYLLEQLDDQRAHNSATKAMSTALVEVLAAGSETHDDSRRPSQSPVKSSQRGLKPLRLVQANLSDSHDPGSQLLRQLDVRLPSEMDVSTLTKASMEKMDKVFALQANTERNISDSIAQSLAEADTDLQQLLRAAFAHSQYGTVHLESHGVRSGIEGVEAQTQDLSEKMRKLDLEAITMTARAKQKDLMER